MVGHEMGHYVLHHVFQESVEYGLIALVGFFVLDRLFAPTARLLGARGVAGISDPAGLPVIGVLITVIMLALTPLVSSITRVTEAQADRFSLEHFNEPDGLARALVKTIEYRADSPSRLEEILFYNHPSVGHRVRAAMDWKAAHPRGGDGSGRPRPRFLASDPLPAGGGGAWSAATSVGGGVQEHSASWPTVLSSPSVTARRLAAPPPPAGRGYWERQG